MSNIKRMICQSSCSIPHFEGKKLLMLVDIWGLLEMSVTRILTCMTILTEVMNIIKYIIYQHNSFEISQKPSETSSYHWIKSLDQPSETSWYHWIKSLDQPSETSWYHWIKSLDQPSETSWYHWIKSLDQRKRSWYYFSALSMTNKIKCYNNFFLLTCFF